MDANKRMADLVSVTTRLIDLLERENEILRERRHNDLHLLLDEKETIGRVYQARIMGLQENPEQLKECAEPDRAALKDLANKVDGLIAENALMLEAAILASRRVVDMVAEAIRDTSNRAGTYSRKGATKTPVSKRGLQRGAISLDQTL